MSTDLFGEVVSDAVPVEPAKVLRTEVRAPARSPVPRRDMTDDEREADLLALAERLKAPELRSRLGQVLQAKEEKARIAKGVACG